MILNDSNLKCLLFDIDGVLTNGKTYSHDYKVSKTFSDHDWTALKLFKKDNIKLMAMTADPWNLKILSDRKIPVCYTMDNKGRIDKLSWLPKIEKYYSIDRKNMAYVGDDIFDIPLMKAVKWSFCPKNANRTVLNHKQNIITRKNSGEGIIMELYYYFSENDWINDEEISRLIELDAKERQ